MALFGRRKSKSLFDKPTRGSELKKRRRVFGRASIAQTATPYSPKIDAPPRLKLRRKVRHTSANKLALPPHQLTGQKLSGLKKIIILLLIAFIIGGLVYLIFFSDFFLIQDYQIFEEGTQITDNLQLNGLADEMLVNKNVLLLDENTVTARILKDNPEYKTVSLKKILPKSIEIDLVKYPVAANIIDDVDGADGIKIEKKYLVNSNGMIIAQNDENPDLPYIRVSTKEALGMNAFALDQEKLDYIIKLVNLFEEKFGINVQEADYLKAAREVHLKTEKNFEVWFDLGKDMLSQIDKLKRALPKLDIYKTPLEYIDLRISGTNAEKVIFKPR